MAENDLDKERKRWSEEIRPWARELAIRLDADRTDVALAALAAEWYGRDDPDWGKTPGCKLTFRVAVGGHPQQRLDLAEIRFGLDFDSYDVVYRRLLSSGTVAPPDFLSFLETTPPQRSATAPPGASLAVWVETAKGLPDFPKIEKFYHNFIQRWYERPPEIEDIHTITGYDESLLEAGAAKIKGEVWKGELLELCKGLRGKPGWSEASYGGGVTVSWNPSGHTNYFMYIRVERKEPPKLLVFVDPELRGGTVGWRTERYLKNYKNITSLPKSLQAWVMSDVEKKEPERNSYAYRAIKQVAQRGVPHDLERAYQTLRQILIPVVEVEGMHELTGYDESASPKRLYELRHYSLLSTTTTDLAEPLYLYETPVDYPFYSGVYDLGTLQFYNFFAAFNLINPELAAPAARPLLENVRLTVGFEFKYSFRRYYEPERPPPPRYSLVYVRGRLDHFTKNDWKLGPLWKERMAKPGWRRGFVYFLNQYSKTPNASRPWDNIGLEAREKVVGLLDECLGKYLNAIVTGLKGVAPELAALLLPVEPEEMHTMTGYDETKNKITYARP